MIDSIVIKQSYQGDGSTTQFPFSFPFLKATDIKVTIHDNTTGAETTLTSDYYVDTNNSKVLYPGYPPGEAPALSEQPGPLPVGQKLIIYRSTPISQLEDLGDKYPLPIIEDMVDKCTLILQELAEKFDRAVMVEIGSETTPEQLLQEIWDARDTAVEKATESGENVIKSAQWAEGTDAEVAMLGGTHSAKVWAQSEEKVYYIDNVAAMRADAFCVPGMMVMTKGYYTVNDGGAGTYNIRAEEVDDVDDGINVVLLDNGNVAERVIFQPQELDYSNEGFFRFGVMDKNAYCNGLATDGTNYYIGYYNNHGGNSYIIKYDGKGVKLAEYTADGDYHYNSLTWDKNNSCLYALKDGTTIQKFSSALTLIDTITLTDHVYSISVDGLSGNIWGASVSTLYLYNSDFSVYKTFPAPAFPSQIDTSQNFAVYGNKFLFIRNYPNTLVEYDISTETVTKITKFAESIDNTFLGEIEGITVVPVGNKARINISFALVIVEYVYNSVFELSVLDDIVSFVPPMSRNTANPVQTVNLYVDSQSVADYANGTQDAPFRSFLEALVHTAKPLNYTITITNADTSIDYPNDDYFVPTGKFRINIIGTPPGGTIRFFNSQLLISWQSVNTCEIDVENCVARIVTNYDGNDPTKLTLTCRSSDVTIVGDIGNVYNVDGTVRVTGSITRGYGEGSTYIYDESDTPTHTKKINVDGPGVVRLAGKDSRSPFSAIVNFVSNTGAAGNDVYLVTGYGIGGTGRTKYYRLASGTTNVTPTVDPNANAIDFAVASSNVQYVHATIIGGLSQWVQLTFTPST